MILITGCNERYLPRMSRYLDSLRSYATFPVYLAGVGFQPPEIDGVCRLSLTREQNAGSPPQSECIQHGSFLQVLPDRNMTSTILYTDGDLVMQRAVDESEWALLRLNFGDVLVGYNGGAHETLLTEYYRLSPMKSPDEMECLWGHDWDTLTIYNVGCVAATRDTWNYIHREYMKHWQMACETFVHPARQQWLISWIIGKLNPVIMPWSFHAHGHFGMKPGMTRQGDQIYHNGKLALFRHYL